MPAEGIQTHGGRQHFAPEGSRVSKAHPTDLRQADGGPFGIQAAALDLTAWEAEAVVSPLAPRCRIPSAPSEEVHKRSVQVSERLLLARDVDRPNPVELRPESRKLVSLGDVVQPPRAGTFVMAEPSRSLLQRQIVDEARHARELPEQRSLFGGRYELETVATMIHNATVPFGLTVCKMDLRRGRHVVFPFTFIWSS